MLPYRWPIEILFVCTGNQCRSPFAEAVLRARASEGISVSSAGLRDGGVAVDDRTIEHLRRRGLPTPTGLSTRLSPSLIATADLVVGMERHHLREVVLSHPPSLTRAFTLPELVRRGGAAGPRRPDQDLDTWLDAIGRRVRPGDLLGRDGGEDDVADPIGSDPAAYDAVMEQIERDVESLAALLWPSIAVAETVPRPLRLAFGANQAGRLLADASLAELAAAGIEVLELHLPEGADDEAFGTEMGQAITAGEVDAGICVCATGNTSAIAANRSEGVRAAVVHDVTSARRARQRHEANVLCLGTEVMSLTAATDAVAAFLRL